MLESTDQITQKKPRLFSRDYPILFISTTIKRWFPSFDFHTHCLTNRFVCNFLSSSAGFNLCSCFFPAHPCLLLSFPTFSGPSIPRLIAASFSLSDPRCFSFLSSASVLDSDYLASVLPFLLFPVPPHSCFPGARLRSRFLGFPFLSSLISHAFLPGSCTWLRCSFLFALPCFAPTAVPPVLPFRFLTSAVFAPFRSLPFWILTTQPLLLPFPLFLPPPHSGFLSAPLSLSLLRLSPFFPAWFPVHSFPVLVLGFAVCYLSPFLASLPQLFHECLPSVSFRHFPYPVPLPFVR